MKKLLALFLVYLQVGLPFAFGAAYNTRKPSGDWADATAGTGTWTTGACGGAAAGAVPGAGDTANICTGHTVHCTTAAIVGASGATGTVALTRAGTGSLVLDNGCTLSLRGDYSSDRDGPVLTVNAGATFQFNPPDGSTYKVIQTNVGSGFPTLNVVGTATPGTRDAIVQTVRQGTTGGNGYFDGTTNGRSFGLNLKNFKFIEIGGTSQIAINETAINHTNGQDVVISDGLWQAGELHLVSNADDGAGHKATFDKLDIRTPVFGGAPLVLFTYLNDTAIGTNTRSFTNITVYNATASASIAPGSITVTSRGFTWGTQPGGYGTPCTVPSFYTYNASFSLSGTSNVANPKCAFVTGDNVANSAGSQLFGTPANAGMTVDSIATYTAFANPHHFVSSGNKAIGSNTHSNSICDGSGNTVSDVGDYLIEVNANTAQNNILSNSCGTLATLNNAATVLTALHNTVVNSLAVASGANQYGVAIGEGTGAAGQLAALRDNIFYLTREGIHQNASIAPVRQTAAGNWLNNNNFWGTCGSGDPGAPAACTPNNYTHPGLGVVSYLAGNTGSVANEIGKTVSSTPDTTHIVCSGCTGASDFGTAGVQVGDMVYVAARSAAESRITAVPDGTHITFTPAIANLAANDTFTIEKSYWISTTVLYGDASFGALDMHFHPYFHDGTCTIASWATLYSFTTTPQGVARELVKLNGTAYDGSAGTYDARADIKNVLNYYRSCYMPQNKNLMTAGSDSVTPGAIVWGTIKHRSN
jgi:hypothetical protein